jgi:hypothetical protein
MPEYMTSTSLDLVFGSNDYAITGSFPENEEINEIQIIINNVFNAHFFCELRSNLTHFQKIDFAHSFTPIFKI